MKLVNVPYLEITDFNNDLTLKSHVGKGKPVVVMVQGNHCGYCSQAKPDYQKFANSTNKVVATTIQIDGEQPDVAIGQRISEIDPSYRGVPTYLGFNSKGKFVGTHDSGRDTQSLHAFASQLN